MIRALIVDDEVLARKKIRNFLKPHADFEIVGECVGGNEAVESTLSIKPDALFLDIRIPHMDGFAVLERLEPHLMPAVVFVTAHDEYAVKAFNVHALDYLLKPFNRRRFDEAVVGLRHRVEHRHSQPNQRFLEWLRQGGPNARPTDRLTVKSNGRILLLETNRIEWIEAQGDYALLHVGSESYLTRDTMQALESRLNPRTFVRIHRSTIVNMEYVDGFKAIWSGDYKVFLRNGSQLTLSRSFRRKLQTLHQEPRS
jgi:two-component system, LytTR family, response regulator